jgi:hypothetical protein
MFEITFTFAPASTIFVISGVPLSWLRLFGAPILTARSPPTEIYAGRQAVHKTELQI